MTSRMFFFSSPSSAMLGQPDGLPQVVPWTPRIFLLNNCHGFSSLSWIFQTNTLEKSLQLVNPIESRCGLCRQHVYSEWAEQGAKPRLQPFMFDRDSFFGWWVRSGIHACNHNSDPSGILFSPLEAIIGGDGQKEHCSNGQCFSHRMKIEGNTLGLW